MHVICVDKCTPLTKMKHSKLQIEVLKQYRQFLRISKEKQFDLEIIKQRFKLETKKVGLKDFEGIEFLLRRGQKTLESMKDADGFTVQKR
jgi:hypothetical protein